MTSDAVVADSAAALRRSVTVGHESHEFSQEKAACEYCPQSRGPGSAGCPLSAVESKDRLRIFLSHGRDPAQPQHTAFAVRLKTCLEARGHEVWIDTQRLRAGERYAPAIREGIVAVAAAGELGRFVLLMTPHAVRSEGYCWNEMLEAKDHGIRVVPVMLAHCRLPTDIRALHYTDMSGCLPIADCDSRYQRSLKTLIADLEAELRPPRAYEELWRNVVLGGLHAQGFSVQLPGFVGREWIVEAVNRWLASRRGDRAQVFWLVGKPGIGKSVVAASLARKHDRALASYFFRHSQNLVYPADCLRGIAYQIGLAVPGYLEQFGEDQLRRLAKETNLRTLFRNLFSEPVASGALRTSDGEPLFIVIDALDEVTQEGEMRSDFANLIADQFPTVPEWLRFVVTSRTGDPLLQPLTKFGAFDIGAEREKNASDIQRYVESGLAGFRCSGKQGRALDSTAKHWLVDAIVRNSEGVFLYAHCVLTEVLSGTIPLDRPDALPKGLFDFYRQWFDRIAHIKDEREEIRPALAVIAAAFEPLGRDVLSEVLAWGKGQTLEFCHRVGTLFPSDQGGIRPMHRSVMEWLTDASEDPITNAHPAGQHFVEVADGHKRLSDWGWRQYESEGGIESVCDYARKYLPLHSAEAGLWDRFDKLLKDCEFIAAANKTSYLWWYRFEKPEWQRTLGGWLKHLSVSDAERARLAVATTYFNAFWWWGDYTKFEFCNRVLATWEETCSGIASSSPDKALLRALRQFDEAYPRKSDFRGRVSSQGRWQKTQEALLRLSELLRCDGRAKEMRGDQERAHLSSLLDIYRSEAGLYLEDGTAELLCRQALAKIRSITEDRWMKSWFLWQLADILLAGLQYRESLESCMQALRCIVSPDHEVTANIYRVIGDLFWARQQYEIAWACYRLQVWYAYRFLAEPNDPDPYSIEFYKEMRQRWVDKALEMASYDQAATRAECISLRHFWGVPEHLAQAEGISDHEVIERILAEKAAPALVSGLFPFAPLPSDETYAQRVRGASRKARSLIVGLQRQVAEACAATVKPGPVSS